MIWSIFASAETEFPKEAVERRVRKASGLRWV